MSPENSTQEEYPMVNMVESPKEKDEVDFDYKKQKICWPQAIMGSCLITAAVLMGFSINAFSIKDSFDAYFPTKCNYNSTTFRDLEPLGSLFPLGGLFGALPASSLTNKFGSRLYTICFFLIAIFGYVLKILSYFTCHVWLLYFGRLFDGLSSGGLMVSAIAWMFQIVPIRVHMILKPLIQILINGGILLAFIFSYAGANTDNPAESKWWITYVPPILIASFAVVICIFLNEDPRYIYSVTKDKEQFKANLKRIRKDGYEEAEYNHLINQLEKTSNAERVSLTTLFNTRKNLPCIVVACVLNMGQQMCGVNVIVAFTADIIKNIIKTIETPQITVKQGTAIVLVLGLLASILFAPIVGSFKRKISLVIAFSIMSLSFMLVVILVSIQLYVEAHYKHNTLGLQIASIVMYATFLFIFQLGPGPLCWFACVEMFDSNAVGAAQSVTTVANWLGNFSVFLLFPIINKKIGHNTFYIFITVNVFLTLFVSFLMEETKNRTPFEVQKAYLKRWNMGKTLQTLDQS